MQLRSRKVVEALTKQFKEMSIEKTPETKSATSGTSVNVVIIRDPTLVEKIRFHIEEYMNELIPLLSRHVSDVVCLAIKRDCQTLIPIIRRD